MSASPGPLAAALSEIAAGLPADLAALPLTPDFRGKYELQRLLACGSMGAVFLARQHGLARPVAIKFLVSDSDITRARFRREASLMASVSHPHVLRLLDHGDEGGLPYHCFEYLPGGTLTALVSRRGRLPPAEAVPIALQCLSGLAALHARAIVHRDLKPDNVLFGDDGQARIADLGIARDDAATVGLTRDGALLGTPRYMSPEQARGEPAGEPADLYAMGGLIYYMVSGEPPFTSDDPVTLLRRHILEVPRPLDQAVPGTPPRVSELVAQALAKQPADRPPSATAFASSLALALEARASTPPRKETGGHAVRRRTLQRLAAVLASTLLLALMVGVLVRLAVPRGERWIEVPAPSGTPPTPRDPAPSADPADAVRADVKATEERLHRSSVPSSELASSPVRIEHRAIVRELLGRLRSRVGARAGALLTPYQAQVAVDDLHARADQLRRLVEESMLGVLLDSQTRETRSPDFIKKRTDEFDDLCRDIRDVAPAVLLKGAGGQLRAHFTQVAVIPLRPTFQILDVRIRNRFDEEIHRWMREHPSDFVGWFVECERLQQERHYEDLDRALDKTMLLLEAEWLVPNPTVSEVSLMHTWVDVISRQNRNAQRLRDRPRCAKLLAHLTECKPRALALDPNVKTFLHEPETELTKAVAGEWSH